MHLTPEILEGAYEFLKTTPPFRGWRLPPSDRITFVILTTAQKRGHFWEGGPAPEIGVSVGCISHTTPLLVTVAHEMCHLRAWTVARTKTHGEVWRRLANAVCKHHGFDPKEF